MSIRFLKPLCALCAIGTMSLTTSSLVQQGNAQVTNQPQTSQPRSNQQSELNDHSKKCLAELEKVVDLSADQKQKVQNFFLQSEAAKKATWQELNQAQMSAISLEAEMYSTMQARMTPSQKQAFAAARTSQRERMATETQTPDASRQARETSDRSEKPVQQPNGQPLSPSDSFVQAAIISPMEKIVNSLGLNSEEIAKCETACSAYHIKLNAAWNEIHTLHNELVTQEAKTIQAVADVLTKEQITKLENHRTLAMNTGTTRTFFNR